ncbi:putative oxidoreductase [Streptomyces lincolnensis]|uniref:Putative oxidoreductase n=1 Tax=Streptomyces lincolnensis TaxID=1915 RepID=A0A1B1M355_STRLN|nr:putative oxidoreductase [Streptomyces lincolnensis]AXG51781.1 putative oxidoreductase [Streptomyces lincolnensis]
MAVSRSQMWATSWVCTGCHHRAVETPRLIAREGGIALTTGPLDVTDEDFLWIWVEDAVDAFGGNDIVYADAGTVRFRPVDSRPRHGSALGPRSKRCG